ncbi:carbohydrate-binding protein [Catellatospora sp. TT07R-123]|uniref:carbohydrate-binding protein n=1 Tax=Catellatospora sp. TT07R-123 TaxID=2733863 RepID=UPI001BB3847E|nr:carbohydrate-binding protein [Catellatospora sp. TT07R-123]
MHRRPLWTLVIVGALVLTTSPASPAAAAAPPTGAAAAAGLARPAADSPALLGAVAPIGGVVPGLTGAAAQQAAGAAAEHFRSTRTSAVAAAQLHTSWGIQFPINASQGLRATQSVVTGAGTTTTGGDYVYAPTAIPAGSACIEMTTAYTPTGPNLWAWDWCGGRDGVGKLTPMNASFLATYTTMVNGRPAYSLDEHKTSTTANTWTAYLYNFQTHAWDVYFTSSGVYDLPQFPFGWDMFEVYTSVNPATGAGYYCRDLAGRAFESSSIQLSVNGAWTPATAATAPTDSTRPPSGSSFDCPALTFSMVHANDDWLDQIGTAPATASYEAEASGNTRGGQAAVRSLSTASGGAVVGYVGNGTANYLQFNNVNAATAGSRTVTVYYASGENRSVTLSVNGGSPVSVSTPSTGGWNTVGSVSVTLNLAAGANTIRFANPTGWAPDLDRITVS